MKMPHDIDIIILSSEERLESSSSSLSVSALPFVSLADDVVCGWTFGIAFKKNDNAHNNDTGMRYQWELTTMQLYFICYINYIHKCVCTQFAWCNFRIVTITSLRHHDCAVDRSRVRAKLPALPGMFLFAMCQYLDFCTTGTHTILVQMTKNRQNVNHTSDTCNHILLDLLRIKNVFKLLFYCKHM